MNNFGDVSNSRNEILNDQNECNNDIDQELNNDIEMNDNTSNELDFGEFSHNDETFDYMETFQDTTTSYQFDDFNKDTLPETDDVFDNENFFSDSSSSNSSDTEDYIPEDRFFEAVDNDKVDSSGL